MILPTNILQKHLLSFKFPNLNIREQSFMWIQNVIINISMDKPHFDRKCKNWLICIITFVVSRIFNKNQIKIMGFYTIIFISNFSILRYCFNCIYYDSHSSVVGINSNKYTIYIWFYGVKFRKQLISIHFPSASQFNEQIKRFDNISVY